jgi:hypothetical protein
MSLSDKDLETLFFIKLLKTEPTEEDLTVFAGGRLSESRVERVKKRISERSARMSAGFVKNATKKQLV